MTDGEVRTTAVDLELTGKRARPARSPDRTAVVVAALAVIALVVGAVFLRPGQGDVEVTVDEEEPSTTLPEPDTPDRAVPAPIALGAPDDGKESVGLPVAAEPSIGLVDGQTVSVTGSEFPPGESIGVVMCTREAGAEYGGRGVEACNIGHFSQGTSDQQGNVTISFDVTRFMTLDGQAIDCASEPGRCIIGMGMISDYDQSGGVAVEFDPSVPAPDPPAVELAQTTDLADGEVIGAKVTGLSPRAPVHVEQCADDDTYRCVVVDQLLTDADGTFDGEIRLWRAFGTWIGPGSGQSPNVDCAFEACVLRFQADAARRAVPEVSVAFDAEHGARVPPTIRLLDDGPFGDGDTLEIAVDGLADGTLLDMSVCAWGGADAGMCFASVGGPYDGTGTFSATMHIDLQGQTDPCRHGCVLVAATYGKDGQGGQVHATPPPLFPEPIPISITP